MYNTWSTVYVNKIRLYLCKVLSMLTYIVYNGRESGRLGVHSFDCGRLGGRASAAPGCILY